MSTRGPSRVIIVGGGFAGRAAWNTLRTSRDVTVVLVDDKPFFEFTPSILRCLVQPPHIRSVTFEHSEPDLSFVLGNVTHITQGEATIARQEQGGIVMQSIPFDYCIWATGVTFSRPIKSAVSGVQSVVRRAAEMAHYQSSVMRAKEVLIIGGGLVGVELCAELAGVIRDNTVTLTLASPRILPRLPPSAGNYATKWLQRRNVTILNQRLKPSKIHADERYEYRTESGETILADMVFDCTGARANGAANALVSGDVCDPSSVNRDGSINVLDTLQVPNSPNFFVAGDAARVDGELELSRRGCEKTAYAAQEAGILAAKNVAVLVRGEALARRERGLLRQYPADVFPKGMFPRMFVVSLYKYHGILCIGPLVVTGWFPAIAKIVIEFLGVRTAKSNGVAAVMFRAVEGLMFSVTVLVTTAWTWVRRPSAD